MKNIDSALHVSGRSAFINDLPLPERTLHAAVAYSKCAHGKIRKISKPEGAVKIYLAEDIPGENQIGGIIRDETLLADGEVHFWGEPIALVVAEDERTARAVRDQIEVAIDPLPVVSDPREAFERDELIMPPNSIVHGDVEEGFRQADFVVSGSVETGGQEHLYLEPQGALAVPSETGIRIHSSTQGPTAVQRTVAGVLGLPMHQIEVEVHRLGGGFGGKEDQATPWAALAALAAKDLQRPVKLVLHRIDDLRMTGKRHPYSSDFRIGLTKAGKITGFEATYYQNSGAAADLSPAVLSRTLLHATNSYYVPHVKVTGYCCRTNLPPNTAFRGFGGPQGMFVIEAAIRKAAEEMDVPAEELQRKNLLAEGDQLPYGQKLTGVHAIRSWDEAVKEHHFEAERERINRFNQEHDLVKKGLAFMPICFGISFTKTSMNQASALVHVYTDGSVHVSTAAVEMGQGVNTKIVQVVARSLDIPVELIHIGSTNTARVANTSPTAASTGGDLNGKAAELACLKIRERLLGVARKELNLEEVTIREGVVWSGGKPTALRWEELVALAHEERASLSAQAFYRTPHIHFDPATGQGSPFAYHVYGTSLTEVTLDCLRGQYEVDAVRIVHDFGTCLNTPVDLGQLEGALMQGIGWVTMEEVLFDANGKPLTDTLSTYKVPDIYAAPKKVDVTFLSDCENPFGLFNSKAIGEPPLMYGIGAFFALREAMKAAAPGREFPLIAPLSPERVLMQLWGEQ